MFRSFIVAAAAAAVLTLSATAFAQDHGTADEANDLDRSGFDAGTTLPCPISMTR